MNRVFRFWFFRRTVPLLVIELIAGWIALYFIGQRVFVEKVVSNALTVSFGNPFELFHYAVIAFMGTGHVVKIVIIISLAALLLLLRDINRSVIEYAAVKRNEMHGGA